MQITIQRDGGAFLVRLHGRLDSTWAATVTTELEESIREGARHLRLHMAEVSYMSSAGIRVLMATWKQLQAIQGSLTVVEPSDQVRSLLELSGLEGLMLSAAIPSAAAPTDSAVTRVQSGALALQFHPFSPSPPAHYRMLGDPRRLETGQWQLHDVATLTLDRDSFAIGIAALGNRAEEGWDRFGEFMAVAGAAVYQPTDHSAAPDYLLSTGPHGTGIQVLYALACEGRLPGFVRFETAIEAGATPFSQIIQAVLAAHPSDNALGIVMVAESAGLVGAALKGSPVQPMTPGTFFDHPAIRKRISFSPERVHARNLALITGVVSNQPHARLVDFLRPLGADSSPMGHFHAVVMPFRPLAQDRLPLRETVASLFETGSPLAVLHLLRDGRELGSGESRLQRGVAWFGPTTAANNPEPRQSP